MQQAQDCFRILGHVFIRHNHRRAHRQRNVEFKRENVERERRQRQQPRRRVDV